jgi:GTP-binding protein
MTAQFIAEVRPGGAIPPLGPTEIAIAGRSNVGKSTLLNRMVGRHALARTSKTPGRTRGIMFYDLALRWPDVAGDAQLRLVDLPGYGYAQVSQDERRSWQPLIEGYVQGRQQLIEWLGTIGVAHRLVVTKVDKLGAGARGAVETKMRRTLPAGSPPPLLVSGETGDGLERLWHVLGRAAAAAGKLEGPP